MSTNFIRTLMHTHTHTPPICDIIMVDQISNLLTLLYTAPACDHFIPVLGQTGHGKALRVKPTGACDTTTFQLQLKRVTLRTRVNAWKALLDMTGDPGKWKWMAQLLLRGTQNQTERHLKRKDRFRAVAFAYANGISPHVLREWLWVTGLLETSTYGKTVKRWQHVEDIFIQFEKGQKPIRATTWEVGACCNGAWANDQGFCRCKYRGKKTVAQTGTVVHKEKKTPISTLSGSFIEIPPVE